MLSKHVRGDAKDDQDRNIELKFRMEYYWTNNICHLSEYSLEFNNYI